MPKKKISDDHLIKDLQRVAALSGKTTVTARYYKENGHHSSVTLETRFGSWSQALQRAGLDQFCAQKVSDEDLMDDLKRVAKLLGKTSVTNREYKKYGAHSVATQEERFGSWGQALQKAGLRSYVGGFVSSKNLLADLRRVAGLVDLGGLTSVQYKRHGRHSMETVIKRFGTWNQALRRAGLTVGVDRRRSVDICLVDLQRVAADLGQETVTKSQYDQNGKYPRDIQVSKFGSWNQALFRANLKTIDRTGRLLSTDLLASHADTLSLVLRVLRLEAPDLTSDILWQAIRQQWSEQDLIVAVETFRAGKDISAFHALLTD